MAILKTEVNKGYIGRVGNTVTYVLNGQIVKRTIGKSSKKPTVPQLSARQKTTIIARFLNPVKEFINVGFGFEARRLKKNTYNLATSYNWLNAISGSYPEQKIDFTKVLLSKGKIGTTNNIEVKVIDNKLEFTWDIACANPLVNDMDRIILVAYSAENNGAVWSIGSAERSEGIAHLIIPKKYSFLKLETYVSFVSADYKSISNSIYTGQFSMPV